MKPHELEINLLTYFPFWSVLESDNNRILNTHKKNSELEKKPPVEGLRKKKMAAAS